MAKVDDKGSFWIALLNILVILLSPAWVLIFMLVCLLGENGDRVLSGKENLAKDLIESV